MPQVAGRRADQLGHLMLHLELAAIDLEDVLFRTVQDFGEGFNVRLFGRVMQVDDEARQNSR